MGIVSVKLAQTVVPSWISRLKEMEEPWRPSADVPPHKFAERYPTSSKRWGFRKKKNKASYLDYERYLEDERLFQTIDALCVVLQVKEIKDIGLETLFSGDLIGENDSVFDVHGLISEMIDDLCSVNEGELQHQDSGKANKERGKELSRSLSLIKREERRLLRSSSSFAQREERRLSRSSSSVVLCLPSDISSESMKRSMPVLQHSEDPYEDFKDSIMQMILENDLDLQDSDLEDLLYCYFSMNTPDLYDAIEKAYWDSWIDLLSVFLIHS